MTWSPTPPLEAFAEALSVPPMIHTPARTLRVLVIGAYAIPLAKLALRYPETAEVVAVVEASVPLPRDRRIRRENSLKDLTDWKADVAAIAVPGDLQAPIKAAKQHLVKDGVVVVALDQFARGRETKQVLQRTWSHVIPYREHAPEPVLFFLASDRRISAPVRKFPEGLRRITPVYLQSLFTLGKDEYNLLYGDRS